MIKELMKKFSKPAQATTEEVNQMTQATEQATASADNPAVADMAAQLASQTAQMTELQVSLAALTEKYAAAEAALAASAEAQAALVAAAEAKVQAARTEKLVAIMGDVKGPQTAASLSALNDEAFEVVLASYAANYEAESKSEMFSEKGVAAEAAPVVEEDAVKRLAATFAAQFKTK
jgi:phage FluMu protein gp41